ncbi:MAG: membrane protease YdiL (CAAX protease family) [Polyangiales bacterium]|jgi:membrane protease YdiL (CAAX protease family)
MATRPWRDVLGTYLVVSLLTFAVTRLRGVPALHDYIGLVVAAIFLGAALQRVGRSRSSLDRYGIALGGLLAPPEENEHAAGPLGLYDLGRLLRDNRRAIAVELGVALGLCLLVFPPYLFAFGYWNDLEGLPTLVLSADFASFALAQFIVVALPEEAFFRGFVQTRLNDHFRPSGSDEPWRGVHMGALLLQAFLFALIHFLVDDFNPARLAVFFPGFLFGLLRARRGGIGAAIVFHALCNVYGELLYRGWVLT